MLKKGFYFLLISAFLTVLSAFFTGCTNDELKIRSEKLNNYDMILSLHTEDKSLSGHTTFTYTNRSDSTVTKLRFQLYANAYREGAKNPAVDKSSEKEAYPNGLSYGEIIVSEVKTDGEKTEYALSGEDEETLDVTLKKELFAGDSVTVEITYRVVLANVRHRTGYTTETYNLANVYPVLCYEENGNFTSYPYVSYGDPFVSQTANYSVTLILPENYSVAHSGSLIQKNTDNSSVSYKFEGKCIRDFAFCASDKFCQKTVKADDTEIKYFYVKDTDPDASLNLIRDCFDFFEKTFGDYPYDTYCVAETGLESAGMEYPNLVFIADNLGRESFNKVLIHETAHQWWYGIVGNNQFENAWMDEGLAEYSVIAFYKACPEYGNAEETLKKSYTRYKLYFNVLKDYDKDFDTSLTRSLVEFKNAQTYVTLTYLKGMLMMDSLRDLTGEKKFFKALRRYYKAGKFSIASPELFIECFEKEYGAKMNKWFTAWLSGNTVIG